MPLPSALSLLLCFLFVSISLLFLPYLSLFLFSFPLVSFLSSSLSPVLFISLPQHPVPYLWCILVLAKARPGRTGGYLVRQRSPWAPTPFPPPGAAQVSRWKVRGARWGRPALGLKPGLRVSSCGTRDQAARRQSQPSRQLRRGAPGEEGNGGSCPHV